MVGGLVQKGTHGFDQTRQRARATRVVLNSPRGDRLRVYIQSLGILPIFWCLCFCVFFFQNQQVGYEYVTCNMYTYPERFFAWAFYSKYVSELDEDEERELEGMIKERLACP